MAAKRKAPDKSRPGTPISRNPSSPERELTTRGTGSVKKPMCLITTTRKHQWKPREAAHNYLEGV